jgi:hypothetical protein
MAPLVLGRHRPAHRQHGLRRDRGSGHVVLRDRVALLAVVEPVELPLAEPEREVGQRDDHDEERDPASAEQESHADDSNHCLHP